MNHDIKKIKVKNIFQTDTVLLQHTSTTLSVLLGQLLCYILHWRKNKVG